MMKNSFEVGELLISSGADVNAKDNVSTVVMIITLATLFTVFAFSMVICYIKENMLPIRTSRMMTYKAAFILSRDVFVIHGSQMYITGEDDTIALGF